MTIKILHRKSIYSILIVCDVMLNKQDTDKLHQMKQLLNIYFFQFLQLVIVIRMAPNLATRKVVCVIVKTMLLERIVTNVAIGIMAPF